MGSSPAWDDEQGSGSEKPYGNITGACLTARDLAAIGLGGDLRETILTFRQRHAGSPGTGRSACNSVKCRRQPVFRYPPSMPTDFAAVKLVSEIDIPHGAFRSRQRLRERMPRGMVDGDSLPAKRRSATVAPPRCRCRRAILRIHREPPQRPGNPGMMENVDAWRSSQTAPARGKCR